MFGGPEEAAIRQYQADRKQKQQYLRENITDIGYDASDFAQFLGWQREDGTNIDNWTMEDLAQCVRDYYVWLDQQHQAYAQQPVAEQQQPMTNDYDRAQSIAYMNQAMDKAENDYQYQNDYYSDQSPPQNEIQEAANQASQAPAQVDESMFEDIKAKNRYRTPLMQSCKQLEETSLNNKRIQIRVTEGKLVNGGLFSASYLLFRIKTEPVNYSIFRKDQDFYFLRKMLNKMFPYLIVPPLPIKKKKESEKTIKRREKYLTRFMQAVCRSEEFKSYPFLIEFLKNDDIKEFQKIMKNEDKKKYVRNMGNVVNMQGRVPAQMISNSAVFCSKMTDFIDSYQILYNEVIECAKDINEKSQALASTMFAMHKFIEQLSELNRMTRCQDQHEMYAWLSKMITGTGNFIAQQGELFKQFLGSHMKYHLLEHESFREILKQRDEIKNTFIKSEKSLIDKKERLFKNRDFSKWGYTGAMTDLDKLSDKFANNKDAAFTYMLQKETKDLELQREELSFYSNQCLDETRRVGKDNGKLLIDHFIQMSQTQCSYINQTHVMWADFLSHFQEEADGGAAYNEADVGQEENEEYGQVTTSTQQYNPMDAGVTHQVEQLSLKPQVKAPEEAKVSLVDKIGAAALVSVHQAMADQQDDNDGGSGGTTKIDHDEDEVVKHKKKQFLFENDDDDSNILGGKKADDSMLTDLGKK